MVRYNLLGLIYLCLTLQHLDWYQYIGFLSLCNIRRRNAFQYLAPGLYIFLISQNEFLGLSYFLLLILIISVNCRCDATSTVRIYVLQF